jgi:hypothetical protein
VWIARKFEAPIDLVAALWVKIPEVFASDGYGPVGRIIWLPTQHDRLVQQHAERP